MKQTSLTLILCILILLKSFAQEESSTFYSQSYNERSNGTFAKSARLIAFSYGFPIIFNTDELQLTDVFYYKDHTAFGPVVFRFEFGIRDEIGISFSGSYAAEKWKGHWDFGDAGTVNVAGYGLAAMGHYHFNKLIPVKKLDAYASSGLHIIFDKWLAKNTDYPDEFKDSKTNVMFAWLLGARYYFSSHFGVFAEGGNSGLCKANIGLTIRMR